MEADNTYHIDFTTASNVEIFIARIEEILVDWSVPNFPVDISEDVDFNAVQWGMSSETLKLLDPESMWDYEIEFQLTRYYVIQETAEKGDEGKDLDNNSQPFLDLLSTGNDFCKILLPPSPGPHPLARWYGIRDFVVLVPDRPNSVDSETKVKTLLSCLQIAVSNTDCGIPVFLQAGLSWQNYFLGLCRSRDFNTDFEMIHLERVPTHSRYLTGLLSLFKSKIGACTFAGPVTVAVRFTYIVKEWPGGTWAPLKMDRDYLGGDELNVSELSVPPFGARCDPIGEFSLSAIWPRLLENSVVDGESYSDLEPLQTAAWRLTVETVPDLSCLLTDCFTEFIMVGKSESKLSAVTKALSGWRGVQPAGSQEGPIPVEVLMPIWDYLFPDADEVEDSPTYQDRFSTKPGLSAAVVDDENPKYPIEAKLKRIKSAPVDSLVWRLSVVMAHVIHSLGGVKCAQHLWNEFTQELRYRCHKAIPIPGLEFCFPDPRSCILNQKLQLINCCIARRIERDRISRQPLEDSDSEPDEFFDASEEEVANNPERKRIRRAPWDQPTGRLSKHGDLLLLETGEPLYVPCTQDPVPRTEEQLEEHADILLQLGTDAEGAAIRARLMSASLLSDMEAFKAANPGGVMADFIRWFSPRDWIEEEDELGQKKGHLSPRMVIPGNTWSDVWEVAKPVPARCQRRLFDDTKEMEKGLMYLEGQSPSGFTSLLLPTVIASVIHRLETEAAIAEVPGVREALDHLIKKAENLSRMATVVTKNYEDLIPEISAIEVRLVQFNALYHFFLRNVEEGVVCDDQVLRKFVCNLLTSQDVLVPGGTRSPLAGVLQRCLSRSHQTADNKPEQPTTDKSRYSYSSFPPPTEKEFILRAQTSKGPQRLYAILKKDECRFSGAFTSHDIFS